MNCTIHFNTIHAVCQSLFAIYTKNFAIRFTAIQSKIPTVVGKTADNTVRFSSSVSLRIVARAVRHGKWQMQKIPAHRAVTPVQPAAISALSNAAPSAVTRLPPSL